MIEKLIKEIRNEKFELNPEIVPQRRLHDSLSVRAYICEMAVFGVLKKYNFEEVIDFSSTSQYDWVRKDNGIQVMNKDGLYIHEYDELGHMSSQPFLIEVKSAKMNGYQKKFQRAFRVAKDLFDEPPIQLLFCPYRNSKKRIISSIEKTKGMYCINTGWSKNKLTSVANEFYEFNNNLK